VTREGQWLGTEVERNREANRRVIGRSVCLRCGRPRAACYCAHVTPVETRTRLLLLQHPRERYVAIGTARMASLCLPNSELLLGTDFHGSAPLSRALSDPSRPPILLYPGEGAIDITANPPAGPVTLVVVDGTWSQTKKLVRINPTLAELPRYAFVPPRPSDYRIRKEPDAASVATIEALVYALGALEGDPERLTALLAPFRAMIDFQIACEQDSRDQPTRHAQHRSRVRRQRVPRVISDRLADIVCVAAEANAWPYSARATGEAPPDELVHWAAVRPATGEIFSVFRAPTHQLAPGTVRHTGLDEAAILGGGSLEELHLRWRGFLRDRDVVCSWGHYETNLFLASGGALPGQRLDLRHVARDVSRGTVGALSDYRDRHPPAVAPSLVPQLVPGRAGRKLEAITDIVRAFAQLAQTI
jgi:DTW domain-containing protein YfiP